MFSKNAFKRFVKQCLAEVVVESEPPQEQWNDTFGKKMSGEFVVGEEAQPEPYDDETDTFQPSSRDRIEKSSDKGPFIITAKSGPETVYFVDSLTQGRRFIPSAYSMAVRFPQRDYAEKQAEKLKITYLGLRNSIKVEPAPIYEGVDINAEKDPYYVEYVGQMPGEIPFTMRTGNGEEKFEYVKAKYPNGKIDIGVYAFRGDMVYGYNAFRKMMNINENKTSKIMNLIKECVLEVLKENLTEGFDPWSNGGPNGPDDTGGNPYKKWNADMRKLEEDDSEENSNIERNEKADANRMANHYFGRYFKFVKTMKSPDNSSITFYVFTKNKIPFGPYAIKSIDDPRVRLMVKKDGKWMIKNPELKWEEVPSIPDPRKSWEVTPEMIAQRKREDMKIKAIGKAEREKIKKRKIDRDLYLKTHKHLPPEAPHLYKNNLHISQTPKYMGDDFYSIHDDLGLYETVVKVHEDGDGFNSMKGDNPAATMKAQMFPYADQNDKMRQMEESEGRICSSCNGSGEGMADGTKCSSCGGSGDADIKWGKKSRERDPDDDRDDRQDRAREWGGMDEGISKTMKTLFMALLIGYAGSKSGLIDKLQHTPEGQKIAIKAQQMWNKIPQAQRTVTTAKQVWKNVMTPTHISDPTKPLPNEVDMDASQLADKYADRDDDIAQKTSGFSKL